MTLQAGETVDNSVWYQGDGNKPTFDAKNFGAAKDSPLTVTNNNGSIRVYFKQEKAPKQLTCARNVGAPDYWTTFPVAVEGEKFPGGF